MTRTTRLASSLACIATIFTATACISTKATPPDDITGDWHGSYKDNGGNTGNIDATFTQSGTTLGGSMVITWGCAVANDASVSGTITGNDFSATMVYGFTTVNIKGTRSGESVSGTFTVSGGICNGDQGTFTFGR